MWLQIYECFLLWQNKNRSFYQLSISFPVLLINCLIYKNITFSNEQKVFQKRNRIFFYSPGGLFFLENAAEHIWNY